MNFGELLPSNGVLLSKGSVPRSSVGAAIESAYVSGGLCGCFLSSLGGDLGRAARWVRDEFRDKAGRGKAMFGDVYNSTDTLSETGYVASKDAFEQFAPDKAPDAIDWLFRFVQGSGCCVGASGVKMLQGLVGTRAADPANREAYKYLPAMWAYAFRGSCGGGWYMGAHASVTLEHGYAFALPDFAGVNYDHEDDGETYTTSKWCSSGPPQKFRDFVSEKGWRFEEGAITEFSGRADAIKKVVQAHGQIHHGSVCTSGSSKPSCPNADRITRCGGHAQTMFGADWSEQTLKFFNDKGCKFTADDFPCINHQTWGEWSGGVSIDYWPQWWGPKPEGAWICSANQMLKYFLDEAYVYLPKLKGWSDDAVPVVPKSRVSLSGPIYAENGGPIRGDIVATVDGVSEKFIVVPDGAGSYVFARKTL